jgi:hypothetical protein
VVRAEVRDPARAQAVGAAVSGAKQSLWVTAPIASQRLATEDCLFYPRRVDNRLEGTMTYETFAKIVELVGSLLFGLVIGWVTYRTLRRNTDKIGLSNIASVIGAVGGATITGLFKTPESFGLYSIGLAIGFFLYLRLGTTIWKDVEWLGDGS